jgi:hypothetical protein
MAEEIKASDRFAISFVKEIVKKIGANKKKKNLSIKKKDKTRHSSSSL